jgi:hypothetical protein
MMQPVERIFQRFVTPVISLQQFQSRFAHELCLIDRVLLLERKRRLACKQQQILACTVCLHPHGDQLRAQAFSSLTCELGVIAKTALYWAQVG